MCRMLFVLALSGLYLGLVHSFSWDIVLARDESLDFFYNGILMYTVLGWDTYFTSIYFVTWMTYDPVNNRVLYTNQFDSEYSSNFAYTYDIETQESYIFDNNLPNGRAIDYAYDPVTELLFTAAGNTIHSFSLKPGFNRHFFKEVDGNVVIKLEKDKTWFRGLAVDSCGRYIYWITDTYEIERARFNGTGREVIIKNSNNVIRERLTIETQVIYWIENQGHNDYDFNIESADLNGNNRRTLYSEKERGNLVPHILTVSKDFIYWGDSSVKYFWQYPKNSSRATDVKPTQISILWFIQDIAVNYKIEEQIQNCEALKSNNDSLNVSTDASLLCVHGTKVNGKSLCECTQGYTGERCYVSVCQNYCLQGYCSVSAEGQPKCSCNTSYSGNRCEVNDCEGYCLNHGNCSLNKNSEPVCQCTEGYAGERCNVSVCQNYCFQGNCSVSSKGQPICSCNAGYSGKRCEVSMCQGYCSHHGVCSLNENSVPVCKCLGDYVGKRCDVPVFLIKCVQTVTLLRDFLEADETPVTLGKGVKATCASTTV